MFLVRTGAGLVPRHVRVLRLQQRLRLRQRARGAAGSGRGHRSVGARHPGPGHLAPAQLLRRLHGASVRVHGVRGLLQPGRDGVRTAVVRLPRRQPMGAGGTGDGGWTVPAGAGADPALADGAPAGVRAQGGRPPGGGGRGVTQSLI